MKKKLATGIALVTLTVALCSCTAGGNSTSTELSKDVSIDKYSDVTAHLDFQNGTAVLPMDQYSLQEPAVQVRMMHAIAAKTDACMKAKGFPAVSDTIDWKPFPRPENRRYGLWSVSLASKYGFELSPDMSSKALSVDTLPYGVDFNKSYQNCSTEAKEGLKEQINFFQSPNVDYRIRDTAQTRALANPLGKEAHDAWMNCMEQQGIVLAPDSSFPSQQYKAQGKEAEIGAAVTQAQCAASTGAAQTLYDLQARYERAYMDAQAAQLQAYTAERDRVLQKLDEAVAGR